VSTLCWLPRLSEASPASVPQAFLSHPGVGDLLNRQGRSNTTPLHLALLPTFGLHCADGTLHRRAEGGRVAPTGRAAPPGQGARPGVVRGYGLVLVFGAAEVLFTAAATWPKQSAGWIQVLGGAHIMLRWLAVQPTYIAVRSIAWR